MSYLIAALVLIGIVALLNLGLTIALVRRWAAQANSPVPEHSRVASVAGLQSGPAVGATLPPFAVTDLGGTAVTRSELHGSHAVLAFFSTNCPGCREQVPRFREFARRASASSAMLVAFVAYPPGDEANVASIADQLSGVARVVPQPLNGDLARRLDVRAWPSYILVDADGVVLQNALMPEQLALPVSLATPVASAEL